jgi:serine/threonine-protein kinase
MTADPSTNKTARPVRLGKYEVVSHIATGGMGAVYRARDVETGRDVALKVLSPEMASQPAMVERFRREARSVARLRHENVVTLYEFGESAGTYYLALEFVDGRDLHDHVEAKGPLASDFALECMIQACRALDHAHRCGIVHRDVKPSNFLLATRDGRPLVKLTDMGLAREAAADEFRVTRAGTTVGTLDFMSPEQARDSGSADIRSDLYSLGGTWFFLLTAQPPFPKGGLGERLFKIMNEEAPDVRSLRPDVPESVAAVIRRLLLKDRSARYQTPRELLDDLRLLKQGAGIPTTPAQPVSAERAVAPTRRRKAKRPSSAERSRRQPTYVAAETAVDTRPSAPRRPRRKRRPRLWPWIMLAGTIIAVVGGAVALALVWRGHYPRWMERAANVDAPPSKPAPATIPPVVQPAPDPVVSARPEADPPRPTPRHPPEPTPRVAWKPLYQPSRPIKPAALRKEMEAAWAAAPPAAEPVVLEVSRGRPGPGTFHHSLAAACAAAPAGKPCVLEIHDNGPFFDGGLSVTDRQVTIRAARGYRPLLVWDVERTLAERRAAGGGDGPLVFLDVQRGGLTLQDVDLAARWPEALAGGPAIMARVREADLTATDCSFSSAGRPAGGIVLARLQGSAPAGARAAPSPAPRCRLTRCVARGSYLGALDIDAPGSQTLLDGCLLAGGDSPLIQVHGRNDNPATVRAVRCTAVAGQTFLSVRPARPVIDRTPALRWFGWDVLVSRPRADAGGNLVRLDDEADPDHIDWQAVNCLYAGWGNLLGGSRQIPATAVRDWRLQWLRVEGDDVADGPWPSLPGELAELTPRACALTPELSVARAGTAVPDQPLGCDVAALPPLREHWLTAVRTDIGRPPAPLPEGAPPEVPNRDDGRYHGGPVDLNTTDLGAFLLEQQRAHGLGPEVVLHLSGTGDRPTTPIHLAGHSLVLYFAPPQKKQDRPLVLTPGPGSGDALIQVDNGNLEVIGGTLRVAARPGGWVPPWLLKVDHGDLRLAGCRLEGPQGTIPAGFLGLVHLAGSGQPEADAAQVCLMNQVVLACGRDGIRVEGGGAQLCLRQVLLVTGGSGVTLSGGPGFGERPNVRCVFERSTIAAHDGAVHLVTGAADAPPQEPVLIQSRDSAFLNPFRDRGGSKALLVVDAAVLARGMVLWQGDRDLLDRRLQSGAWTEDRSPTDRGQLVSDWVRLWGSANTPNLVRAGDLVRTLDTTPWQLNRLALPREYAGHGADLSALGVFKK